MNRIIRSKEVVIAKEDGEVFLSSWVGNENLGGGNVKLNGTVIVKGLLDKFSLGIGRDLKGKTFVVRTNGLDINPVRDDVPATHLFTGPGVQDDVRFVYPESMDGNFVADSDGLVSYIISYTFK